MIRWLWERCSYTWELREELVKAKLEIVKLNEELAKVKPSAPPAQKHQTPMSRFRQRGGRLFSDIRRDWYQEQQKYVETDPVLQQVINSEPQAPEVEDVSR